MVKVIQLVRVGSLILFFITLMLTYYEISEQAVSVVIHRDSQGNVTSDIHKSYYFLFSAGFILLLNLFVSLATALLKHMPVSKLRIPNRDFWFESEESRQNLYDTLESWLLMLTAIMHIFMTILIVKVWSVNRDFKQMGDYSIHMFLGIALLIGWVAFIFIRLRIKKFDMV